MAYSIEFETKGAYVKFEGACSYAEVLEASKGVWENPYFDSMTYEIFDYLSVTSIDFSDYDIVEMAVRDSVASKMSRRSKMAVVATLPAIIARTEEYKQSLSDPELEFMVTDSLAAARQWVAS